MWPSRAFSGPRPAKRCWCWKRAICSCCISIRSLGTTDGYQRSRSAIRNSLPTAARFRFAAATIFTALDIATKKVRRLTTDGSARLLNGELDWVYPEELDLSTAHWWSPDSSAIAYLQFDVSHEPVLSAGGPDRHARPPRTGVVSPARHAQRRCAARRRFARRRPHPLDGSRRYARPVAGPRLLVAGLAFARGGTAQSRAESARSAPGRRLHRLVAHRRSPSRIRIGSTSTICFAFSETASSFYGAASATASCICICTGSMASRRRRSPAAIGRSPPWRGSMKPRARSSTCPPKPAPLERQLYRIGMNGKHKERLTQSRRHPCHFDGGRRILSGHGVQPESAPCNHGAQARWRANWRSGGKPRRSTTRFCRRRSCR